MNHSNPSDRTQQPGNHRPADQATPSRANAHLSELGYDTGAFPGQFLERSVDLDKWADSPDDNESSATMSLSAVKHLVMLTRLDQSLDRIRDLLQDDFKVYFGMTTTMAEALGEEKISSKVAEFRRMVFALRNFQVGRGDIFVRRQLVSPEVLRFFEHLGREYPGAIDLGHEDDA